MKKEAKIFAPLSRDQMDKSFFVLSFNKGLLAFFLTPASAFACTMQLVSTMPLTQSGSDFLVDMNVGDKTAHMILDTGAGSSLLNVASAYRLGMRVMRDEAHGNSSPGLAYGIGGGKPTMYFTAHSVNLGGLRAQNFNFTAADDVVSAADGLLSVDVVAQFDIDLDLAEQKVNLFRPVGDCSAPAAFLASPLFVAPLLPFGEDRRPRVKVEIGGVTLNAAIDTGASRSAIFRRAAERLGLHAGDVAADPKVTAHGIGLREVAGVRHIFPAMTVGDLSFERMPMDILDQGNLGDDVDMLLGADFQRQVHLWISYSSGSLIMQYPARPTKKLGGL